MMNDVNDVLFTADDVADALRECRNTAYERGVSAGRAEATRMLEFAVRLNGSGHSIVKALQDEPEDEANPDEIAVLAAIDALIEAKMHGAESGPLYRHIADMIDAGESLKGGLGDNLPDSDFDPEQLASGVAVEMEHTDDEEEATEIAKDHLTEDADYYRKLANIEGEALSKAIINGKEKFGCLMANLPAEIGSQLLELGLLIPDEDLGEDGREKTPHVTIRHGFHDGVSATDVASIAETWEEPIRVRLDHPKCFYGKDNGKPYDVIVFSVSGDQLHYLHDALADLPHTDTHKTYQPHATVAYVKAGLGDKWLGRMQLPTDASGQELRSAIISEMVYADAYRNKSAIPIGNPVVLKAFDESKHPRDHGKFSSVPGGKEGKKDAEPKDDATSEETRGHAADYKANGTKSKAFKSWFGDWENDPANASKVVNSDGSPQEQNGISKPVYHGTARGKFDSFRKDKLANGDDLLFGPGFYFTEDRKVAEYYTAADADGKEGKETEGAISPHVFECYLNIRKPFDGDTGKIGNIPDDVLDDVFDSLPHQMTKFKARIWDDMQAGNPVSYWEMEQILGKTKINEILQRSGYDGITHIGGKEHGDSKDPHRVWIAFEPTQIKAVDNDGAFDPSDPVITKAFDESKHPRGDDGRFIGREAIHAAKSDPALAEKLREKTTDPDERKKLDAALAGEEDLGRTKAGLHRERVATAKQEKADRIAKVRELANDISTARRGGEPVSSKHYRELVDNLPHLTVKELRSIREKLAASFFGRRKREDLVTALVHQAKIRAEQMDFDAAHAEDDPLDFGMGMMDAGQRPSDRRGEDLNPWHKLDKQDAGNFGEAQHGGRMEQRNRVLNATDAPGKTAAGTPDTGSVLKVPDKMLDANALAPENREGLTLDRQTNQEPPPEAAGLAELKPTSPQSPSDAEADARKELSEWMKSPERQDMMLSRGGQSVRAKDNSIRAKIHAAMQDRLKSQAESGEAKPFRTVLESSTVGDIVVGPTGRIGTVVRVPEYDQGTSYRPPRKLGESNGIRWEDTGDTYGTWQIPNNLTLKHITDDVATPRKPSGSNPDSPTPNQPQGVMPTEAAPEPVAKKTKQRKTKKPSSTDTLHSWVQHYGGIDPESHAFQTFFKNVSEARESGIPLGAFKNGGEGLDVIARQMLNSGHISASDEVEAQQVLLDGLANRAYSYHADRTKDYDNALLEYERAKQEAADALDESSIREAERSGQEEADRGEPSSGRREGESGDAIDGGRQPGDAAEPEVGDTSFDFGASEPAPKTRKPRKKKNQ